jgi:hypothetical protein
LLPPYTERSALAWPPRLICHNLDFLIQVFGIDGAHGASIT